MIKALIIESAVLLWDQFKSKASAHTKGSHTGHYGLYMAEICSEHHW